MKRWFSTAGTNTRGNNLKGGKVSVTHGLRDDSSGGWLHCFWSFSEANVCTEGCAGPCWLLESRDTREESGTRQMCFQGPWTYFLPGGPPPLLPHLSRMLCHGSMGVRGDTLIRSELSWSNHLSATGYCTAGTTPSVHEWEFEVIVHMLTEIMNK